MPYKQQAHNHTSQASLFVIFSGYFLPHLCNIKRNKQHIKRDLRPLLRYVHGIISRRGFERKALREVIKKANPQNGLAKFIPHRNVHGIITVA